MPTNLIEFTKLNVDNHQHVKVVEDYFREEISAIYGDQSAAIDKILSGRDRACELLCMNGQIQAFVVYKTIPTDEFVKDGVARAIEQKTTVVLSKDPKYMGAFFAALLNRVAKYVVGCHANGIVGTVSSRQIPVLRLLDRLGFRRLGTAEEVSKSTADEEYLVFHDEPDQLIGDTERYISMLTHKFHD